MKSNFLLDTDYVLRIANPYSILRQISNLPQLRTSATTAASAFHHGKRRNRTYQSGPKAGKTERRLRNTVQYSLKASYGDNAAIGFQFERHGIFLEYGVSRGHPKNGIRRSMSDWFSASLDRQEQKLLDIVSEHQADKYLHTFMGIKK